MKAIWNNEIIAEADKTIIIEGNHYFSPEDVNFDFLEESETHTICPWKGSASYYNIVVNGNTNPDAAWYYPETSQLAESIKGKIAFWKGVAVIE